MLIDKNAKVPYFIMRDIHPLVALGDGGNDVFILVFYDVKLIHNAI